MGVLGTWYFKWAETISCLVSKSYHVIGHKLVNRQNLYKTLRKLWKGMQMVKKKKVCVSPCDPVKGMYGLKSNLCIAVGRPQCWSQHASFSGSIKGPGNHWKNNSSFLKSDSLWQVLYRHIPVVWVWENSNEAWVALSFPFIVPVWDATLSRPWEFRVSTNIGVITVLLKRQFESIR